MANRRIAAITNRSSHAGMNIQFPGGVYRAGGSSANIQVIPFSDQVKGLHRSRTTDLYTMLAGFSPVFDLSGARKFCMNAFGLYLQIDINCALAVKPKRVYNKTDKE